MLVSKITLKALGRDCVMIFTHPLLLMVLKVTILNTNPAELVQSGVAYHQANNSQSYPP